MKNTLCFRNFGVLIAAFAVVMFALTGGAQAASFSDVTLGIVDANNLGVLVTSSASPFTVTAGTDTFNANIGLAPGGTTSFASGTTTVTGTIVNYTAGEISAVQAALATAYGLTPNYTSIGSVINHSTANPNAYGGYDTVVKLGGAIVLNGQTLTINGGSNDYFIINVAGALSATNSSILLSGGVTEDHVLFNVQGTDGIFGNGSTLYGTYTSLAQITFDGGTLNGALIGYRVFGSNSSSDVVTLNGNPYYYGEPTSSVPEPGTMLLLGSGLVGLAVLRRKKI